MKKGMTLEEKKKAIRSIVHGEYPEIGVAKLGENRGQLFVRIPQNIRKRLRLEKDQELTFKVSSNTDRNQKLEVEIGGI